MHHERRDEGTFLSRLVRQGAIALDPPSITLDLDAVYEGLSFDPDGGS